MSFPRYVFHVPTQRAIKIDREGYFKEGNSTAMLNELRNNPSGNIQFVTFTHHLKRIQLELLLNCNLRCLHCYSESGPGKDKGLSFNQICQLVDEAHSMGVIAIDLTGGEPLLRSDLLEIVCYIRSKGILVSLFTNGTLLRPETAINLKQAGVQFVQVSIDGFSSETHDRFRQKSGSLKKAMRAIEWLKQAGLVVKANIVVNKKNLHEIKPLCEYLQNQLQVCFGLDRLIPAGRARFDDEWTLSPQAFYDYIRTHWSNDVTVSKVCDSPIGLKTLEPHCGIGAFYMYIKYNGQAVLCPTMTPAESESFESHNVIHNCLRDVWENGDTFKKYRGVQCRNIQICPSAGSCRGGCRSNAYLLHGEVDSPDEMSCNLNKNATKTYIQFIEEYKLG